ncbi:MAG: hypothetical protein KGI97_06760, partial [Alphaproteobacteria bacterium]|nr:hypothetical protein [Alphaproteobacteria bacterium]
MRNRILGAAVVGLVLAMARPAFAVDKIYSPNVVAGEWELEYFGTRTFDNHADKNDSEDHEFSVGYGVNDHWATEVYALMGKEPGDGAASVDGVQWENRIQFFQPGEYWLDSGLLLAYTH